MKKSLHTILNSVLLFALSLLCLATLAATTKAQLAAPTSTSTTTTDPNGTTITDPLAPPNAFLYNPDILRTVTPATTDNTTVTDPTTPPTTDQPPELIAVPPTRTPPRTTLPPRIVEPPVTPNEQPPVLASCPPFFPFATENVECPKVETAVPVIPQFPIALAVTPLLALALFWMIISYLNNGQIRTEKRFVANSLANAHRQNVDQTRTKEYQNLLDFLSKELSSPDGFHPNKYEMIAAKIQLLGSPQMQNLVGKIDNAINSNDRQSLKPLIKELGQQIKKEL